MLRTTIRPEWQWAILYLTITAVIAALVGFLWWAQAILIPLALAVFFTFVLSPIVSKLERWGLPRIPAVLLTVFLLLVLLGATGWLLTHQIGSLLNELPDHADNIKRKILTVKGWLVDEDNRRLGRFFDEVSETISPSTSDPGVTVAPGAAPMKVVVEPRESWMDKIEGLLNPLLEVLGQVAFSLILVVFMLIQKEDLRNRLLRIAAPRRIATASKAMEDAGNRISRYLLAQFVLNVAYGMLVTIGMMLIGIPYPVLWGFIAGFVRYVPYLGPWVGALLPIGFAFATSDGWTAPVLAASLIIVLELVSNNVFEPWLYGASMGASEIAQLVSAAFWTFLWGPLGLFLASPLTVCLLVLGKYVPGLKVLEILLGHEQPLQPGVALFQRLTARDQDEAARILQGELKDRELLEVTDQTVVPALTHAKIAATEGDLTAEELAQINAQLDEILDDVRPPLFDAQASDADLGPPVPLLWIPGSDGADRALQTAVRSQLNPKRWRLLHAKTGILASEILNDLAEAKAPVAVISSLPPGGVAHARYLCKRLKQARPDVKIIVGRWGEGEDFNQVKQDLVAAGADEVLSQFSMTLDHLACWHPALMNLREQQADATLHEGNSVVACRSRTADALNAVANSVRRPCHTS